MIRPGVLESMLNLANRCSLFPHQCLKTKVIKSCLNPVWNQELTFTVTEPVGVLKLVRALSSMTSYLLLLADSCGGLGRRSCPYSGFLCYCAD